VTKLAVFVFAFSVILWIAGALLDVRVFYALSAFGFASLIVSMVLLFNAGRGIEIFRRNPARARRGDTLVMELEIRSRPGLSHCGLIVADVNPVCGLGLEPIIWVSGLRGGETLLVSYEFEAAVRGEHELGPVEVTTTDPLGLFRRRREIQCPGRLLVLPAWEPVALLPFNSRQRSYLVGVERASVEGEGQEFFGIREYRPGDGMRFVHWRTTARYRRPMVRQFENESRPNISIFLDTSMPAEDDETAEAALDRIAATGLSLALHILDTGSRVSCAAAGQETGHLDTLGGEVQRQQVLQYIARLRPTPDIPAGYALADCLGALHGGDTLVAVLADIDEDVAAVLSGCAYSGRAVVAFLLEEPDPEAVASRTIVRNRMRRRKPTARARHIAGLQSVGIPVVKVDPQGTLDRAIQAWLR
jgi:uncharacterized protein (DUF58 family)